MKLVILAVGLSQNNPLLIELLTEELAKRVTVWPQRHLQVEAPELGYWAGVLGAAAVAATATVRGCAVQPKNRPGNG